MEEYVPTKAPSNINTTKPNSASGPKKSIEMRTSMSVIDVKTERHRLTWTESSKTCLSLRLSDVLRL